MHVSDAFTETAMYPQSQLEQLECLRSEESPHHPMITHTIEQFIFDPKSKQDKVKVTNLINLPKLQNFKI